MPATRAKELVDQFRNGDRKLIVYELAELEINQAFAVTVAFYIGHYLTEEECGFMGRLLEAAVEKEADSD